MSIKFRSHSLPSLLMVSKMSSLNSFLVSGLTFFINLFLLSHLSILFLCSLKHRYIIQYLSIIYNTFILCIIFIYEWVLAFFFPLVVFRNKKNPQMQKQKGIYIVFLFKCDYFLLWKKLNQDLSGRK